MDKLRESSFCFPIADTLDGPHISYSQSKLELRFVDYTEIPRLVVFHDVVSFAVSSIDADPRDLLDDRAYFVSDSSLLARLAETGDIESTERFVHQIICFNETSEFLEIVYRKMETAQP